MHRIILFQTQTAVPKELTGILDEETFTKARYYTLKRMIYIKSDVLNIIFDDLFTCEQESN